jgi:regulator of replication initiation timing
LQEDKRKLTSQLSQSDNALKSAKNQITSLQTEKNKLTQENTQLRNRKYEPETYKIIANRAPCYYIDASYNYKKTGYSYSKNTTIKVYYKNYSYALTEKADLACLTAS